MVDFRIAHSARVYNQIEPVRKFAKSRIVYNESLCAVLVHCEAESAGHSRKPSFVQVHTDDSFVTTKYPEDYQTKNPNQWFLLPSGKHTFVDDYR